jgi:hypothetical protein
LWCNNENENLENKADLLSTNDGERKVLYKHKEMACRASAQKRDEGY